MFDRVGELRLPVSVILFSGWQEKLLFWGRVLSIYKKSVFFFLFLHDSYIIDHGVVYLCICERNYPRKLAFTYLDDLAKEFFISYGNEMDRPGLRPYAFVKFGKIARRDRPTRTHLSMRRV